jgi:hypothetical protein
MSEHVGPCPGEGRLARSLLGVLIVVAVGVAVGVLFWARTSWHDAEVVEVFTVEGSRRFMAHIRSCGLDDRVSSRESEDRVTLMGERRGRNDDDCLDGQAIGCLAAPIGERRVVDATTGNLLIVRLVDAEPTLEGSDVAEPCPDE